MTGLYVPPLPDDDEDPALACETPGELLAYLREVGEATDRLSRGLAVELDRWLAWRATQK